MGKTFKTPKGTDLALMNLKGKDYLIVANRLLWFVEEVPNYSIETNFLSLTEDSCVAHSTIIIFDKEGKVSKRVTATKKETKKDFPDFIEKAETGSLGRALAYLGYGTQFAQQDMEEGERLADAPLAVVDTPPATVARPSFRKAAPKAVEATSATASLTNTTTSNGAGSTSPGTGWE
jgi:hypothetical protein